jgi:hypothetical protein
MARICFAPRTLLVLSLGAVAPLATGMASGRAALAIGLAFAVACPLLAGLGAVWPRMIGVFPLYFAVLFSLAIAVLPFNSAAFVADSWAALLLAIVTFGDAHFAATNARADRRGTRGRPSRGERSSLPFPIAAASDAGGAYEATHEPRA